MSKTIRLGLVVILMLVMPISSGAVSPLKIGVAPDGEDSVALARTWIPFLEKIQANSGVELRFATAPDLLAFNQRLSDGEYDIVVTNQYLFTIFSKKHKLSYMAELSQVEQNDKLVLVSAPEITRIEQLKGALVAVKRDEKPSNVQSLDDFFTAERVTALRDSLDSYDKILESITENLHKAGLVPQSKLHRAEHQYNVLWQHESKHNFFMTTPPGISTDTIEKLASALKALQPLSAETVDGELSVLSVRKEDTPNENKVEQ
jgi:phosphonate transport system substrate-binding protein